MKLNNVDFRNFVGNTYVRLRPCPKAPEGTVGFLSTMEERDDEDDNEFRLTTAQGSVRLSMKESQDFVEFGFPRKCLFNHEDRALMYTRKPIKQFSKGPNDANSSVEDPLGWMLYSKRRLRGGADRTQYHAGKFIQLDMGVWSSLTSRIYLDLAVAYEKLSLKSCVSVALSPEFMIAASANKHGLYPLFHLDIPIGHMDWPVKKAKRGNREIVLIPMNEFNIENCNDFGKFFIKDKPWTTRP